MHKTWTKPVILAIGEDGADVTIDSTMAACWALIEDWPAEDGKALDTALLVCAAVDAGKKTDEDARKAFIAAAIEAGIAIKGGA
ncbi:protein of unknown function DUF982 [Rhizobium sp. PDO1-076]|uniref:DUF982 domain-containing protein n=1 Tax=Rhizobium sp. PDO1-076 TaxID=1125979 RepID=UPI00024E39F1|nr:DUF982 domain-containing protein [Rhizobium sp. PDO1-076]EHS48896.1 protein of unknown function DUF982 [Rhizobium sp. PDO1-076]